jgi:hypothetical protein
MKKSKTTTIPQTWLRCWALLDVQRANGIGPVRTFTSLNNLATAAGCDKYLPSALFALGYIWRDSARVYRPVEGVKIAWPAVQKWIREQYANTASKGTLRVNTLKPLEFAFENTPIPDPLPAPTPDILDNREVVEMALRIHHAGYNVKVWREGGGGVTSLELKA